MKYTLKIALVFIFIPVIAFAANNVAVNQDITLTLPSDSSSYTLKVGSLEEFTINNTSFTFKLSPGDNVELIAPGKQTLSNDASPKIDTTCGDSDSRIFMSVNTAETAKTIVVTPGSACTTSSSSSGGGDPSIGATFSVGGGGGGGSSPPPAPTPLSAPVPAPAPSTAKTISEKIAQIQQKILELRGKPVIPTVSTGTRFLVNLAQGSSNNDVRALQEFLATDPILYPEGTISGYYGSLTRAAVQRFQEKYGIASPGVPGYGNVGPKTREKINELVGGLPAPVPESTFIPAPVPAPVPLAAEISRLEITRGLGTGSSGNDVRALQEFLATDPILYPEGTISGYYGSLTRAAVQRFQEKYGIASPGVPGYGNVGPKTREKIKELTSGSTLSPAPAPSSGSQTKVDEISGKIKEIQQKILDLQAPTPLPAPLPAPVPSSDAQSKLDEVTAKIKEIQKKILDLQSQ